MNRQRCNRSSVRGLLPAGFHMAAVEDHPQRRDDQTGSSAAPVRGCWLGQSPLALGQCVCSTISMFQVKKWGLQTCSHWLVSATQLSTHTGVNVNVSPEEKLANGETHSQCLCHTAATVPPTLSAADKEQELPRAIKMHHLSSCRDCPSNERKDLHSTLTRTQAMKPSVMEPSLAKPLPQYSIHPPTQSTHTQHCLVIYRLH